MKKMIKELCGLLVLLAAVIIVLQVTGIEAKAATYVHNYNAVRKQFTKTSADGNYIDGFHLNKDDLWMFSQVFSIPYINKGADPGHKFSVEIYAYEMNATGDGVKVTKLQSQSKKCTDHNDASGTCTGYPCSKYADWTITSPGFGFPVTKSCYVEILEAGEDYVHIALITDEVKEFWKNKPGHNHSFVWKVVRNGSPEIDQIEEQICLSCGTKGETRTTPAYEFFLEEAKNKLLTQNTPAGGTAEITTKIFNVFPKSLMEKIASRRDIDVVFTYKYDGKNIQVTIPAGTQVDTSCDYYGPVKMMSLYGYTELATFPGEIVASTIPELVNAQAGSTVALTGKDAYSIADMLAISEKKMLMLIWK